METNEQDDRQFNASGFIEFHAPHGTELDANALLSLLLEVDRDFPWLAHYQGGNPAPSIHWHSEMEMKDPQEDYVREWTDRSYTIEIRPFFPLGFGQLAAYQRYVKHLARKLAERDIEKVTHVDGRVIFSGMFTTYRTPSKERESNEFLTSRGLM